MNNANIIMHDLKKSHPELTGLIEDISKGIEYGMNEKLFIRKVHMLDAYLNYNEINVIINCYKNNSIKHKKLSDKISISPNSKMQKKELERICSLNVSESNRHFGRNQVFIYKTDDNWLITDLDVTNKFKIIGIEWNGAEYRSDYRSYGTVNTVGTTKRKGRVLGAVLGTAVAPGIGTVVGALHGTGNNKIEQHSGTSSITQEVKREVPTTAYITIKYKDTNIEERFSILCMTNTVETLYNLVCQEDIEENDNNLVKIKQLKELLDIGAITQEDFDAKKTELLKKI